eukprot:5684839-Pyramimonas_sp.AAC.1
MAFKGIILSAAYSGLETYLLSKQDCRRLDAVVLGLARAVLRDRKPEIIEGAPDGARLKYRSLSESTLLTKMRITNTRAELLVRRLRQWQRFVEFPQDSRQPLVALFGTLEGLEEVDTFLEDGTVSPSANPWA